jgi:hypothetical protein
MKTHEYKMQSYLLLKQMSFKGLIKTTDPKGYSIVSSEARAMIVTFSLNYLLMGKSYT